jgi:glycosyltransferase involved in cell wall biosynthesis
MEMSGFISVITTCKGRMHHLEEALPTWLAQEGDNYEIIVVDYGDPDKSADYVEEMNDPRVRAVRHEAEGFNLSHARNIGALAASEKSDTFMFMDADALMTNDSFLNYHRQKVMVEGSFVTGWGFGDGTGCCMVWRELFSRVRGYNEAVNGWGFDDVDFYWRIEAQGFEQRAFHNGLKTINHDDEDRVRFYKDKNLLKTNESNRGIIASAFLTSIPENF